MDNNFSFHFNLAWLNKVLTAPGKFLSGEFLNRTYEAKIIIPDYKFKISEHYKEVINGKLDDFCRELNFPLVFNHFGLMIEFEKPLQLSLHDVDMNMQDSLHYLVKEIGGVIIKNAYLDSKHRSMGHRNRFPQLNFHVDRSSNQPTHYSMYTRDPFDAEQKHPRKSSTLFVASIVGHLQAIKESSIKQNTLKGNQGSYTVFVNENMTDLLDNIILQHAWNEPTGTGEISIIDNITCLHASYYPNLLEKGYKIGVRYVA